MKPVRCKCGELMDAPMDDGSPYEGLYACYTCEIYHDGHKSVPFMIVDTLVDKYAHDATFKVKPRFAQL